MSKIPPAIDDVAFIKDEEQWPNWPILPVKRYENNELVTGLVFAGRLTQVVNLNMFIGWTRESFDAAPKWNYESVELLVADGWIVD